MGQFPAIDVIPLPAPVWLFKLLHVLLLSLHFVCVQAMLGGLLVAALWSLKGGRTAGSLLGEASRQVTRTLPTLMTYVINLGVPPLLFVQVLFGHAFYAASIVIGAWWISVILLLVCMYYLLYVASQRALDQRPYWGALAASLLLGVVIAFIYSTLMTLMLRPEQWADLYALNAHGTSLPPLDPTKLPRWGYMLCGGLTVGGVAVVALGSMRFQRAELREVMFREGGRIAALGVVLQMVMATLVATRQPLVVHDLIGESFFYHGMQLLWVPAALVVLALAGFLATRASTVSADAAKARRIGWGASLAAVVLTLVAAAYRDGVRDLTLKAKGFDVWSLPVTPNYLVLTMFLVVTVITLAIVGILIATVVRAQPAEEAVTQ
ncbi:MAG: hypothetical protein HZB16_03620 [Armatimonadetes bacterium]|nr:hypothetical protein [Armatimonadota bacterium]